MIRIKYSLLFSLVFLLFSPQVKGQLKAHALGVRGGVQNGFSLKMTSGENLMFEGLLTTRWKGWNVTGMIQKYQLAFETPGMYWYYGAGAHVGVWSDNSAPWKDENSQQAIVGIDGIIGLEYNIKDIPFQISIDYKPALNLVGYQGLWVDDAAFSLRYVF